ncbi:MAG: sigma-70 family RNA polymerase sigma factor [Lachnospiraceae bacterium]|nr:sigma-70 family RNA polymerase sigma factor [Lachnospiraceae bacterium]
MDDQKIIELYFERNEQAIKETEIRFGKLCFSIARNILGNEEDAEECVNDTFMGVWNAIPPAKPNNLTAFVCKIARNQALKRVEFLNRDKRSAALTVSLDELEDILPDDRYVPGMDDEDLGRLISLFLRKQKEDVRNVFIRKYYFFDSIEAIAKRYSFSESKVKSMLFNIRKKLKAYLLKEGVLI